MIDTLTLRNFFCKYRVSINHIMFHIIKTTTIKSILNALFIFDFII